MTVMQGPPETEALTATVRGRRELAAQMYAASLMAIEVDTPAERAYLQQLAAGLGLDAQVVLQIEGMVGVQST